MIIINNLNTNTFTLNGIKYVKNFVAIKQGLNNISISNAYDTKYQLVNSTIYSQFVVNGNTYANQADLIAALATIIFSKNTIQVDYNDIVSALGFTPENQSNKSDSYTVSSSTTYASTKALVDGLGTKVGGTLTTNYIPKATGSSTLENSSITDNGITVAIGIPTTIKGTTATDGGQLGTELLTTGTSDASWTGTSFATGYTHVAGSVTTLTSTLAAVINNYYQITYTVTGRTAGSFTIGFGGYLSGGITATGNVGPKATTTETLIITPTSDFNGTIVLSIKRIMSGSATISFLNSLGAVSNEIRAIGNSNTANGVSALRLNTTGGSNTANGISALSSNTTGGFNTANGVNALSSNTTGTENTANGLNALSSNTTGSSNTANGVNAGRYISNKLTVATILNNSIFLGYRTSPLADNQTNQVVIGYDATGLGSNTTVLGNSSTVQTWLGGRLTIGSTIDDGSSAFQLTGVAKLNTAPTISAGSYDILTRNSTTGVVEKKASNYYQTALTNPVTGSLTSNYLPKANGSTTLTNSIVYDNGTRVGINTSSPLIGSTLDVNGEVYSTKFVDRDNNNFYFDGSNTGDSIRVAGDIVGYYSDIRLKTKLGDIESPIEKVKQLNGFYYQANEVAQTYGYEVKRELGLSAQEVEKVLPEIVKNAAIGDGYLTLDYGRLTPLLIEAIKEQQNQIDELKQMVNQLINNK